MNTKKTDINNYLFLLLDEYMMSLFAIKESLTAVAADFGVHSVAAETCRDDQTTLHQTGLVLTFVIRHNCKGHIT